MNILSILRNFARISWEYFNYNLDPWPRNKESEKPYFCFSEATEIIDYRKSVISEFDLFIDISFILFVEGATEERILNSYVDIKKWLTFKIQNMRGGSKIKHILNINNFQNDKICYYFLDYENCENYKSLEDQIRSRGFFFFPDFITENFKADEILLSFLKFLEDSNISPEESQKIELENQLNIAKEESNMLINQSPKINNPVGYEEILIGFLMSNFQKELLMKFPKLKNHPDHTNISREKLIKKFKKIFTENYIIPILRDYIKVDSKKQRRTFPFEEKLKPFYKRIDEYRLRNPKIQFDLDLNK